MKPYVIGEVQALITLYAVNLAIGSHDYAFRTCFFDLQRMRSIACRRRESAGTVECNLRRQGVVPGFSVDLYAAPQRTFLAKCHRQRAGVNGDGVAVFFDTDACHGRTAHFRAVFQCILADGVGGQIGLKIKEQPADAAVGPVGEDLRLQRDLQSPWVQEPNGGRIPQLS